MIPICRRITPVRLRHNQDEGDHKTPEDRPEIAERIDAAFLVLRYFCRFRRQYDDDDDFAVFRRLETSAADDEPARSTVDLATEEQNEYEKRNRCPIK